MEKLEQKDTLTCSELSRNYNIILDSDVMDVNDFGTHVLRLHVILQLLSSHMKLEIKDIITCNNCPKFMQNQRIKYCF